MVLDLPHVQNSVVCDASRRLGKAKLLVKRNRTEGLAALNELFREGMPPAPLNGRYAGDFLALSLAPGLTPVIESILEGWMPWLGKVLDVEREQGTNVFRRDAKAVGRILFPFYEGYVDDSPGTFCAFDFHTYFGSGRQDPDRQVFKIDYAQPDNPPLSVRRVLDEVVQLDEGLYLGKAHFQWWWGTWQMAAFFALRPAE